MLKILINSRTSGKYTTENIAGREHIVVPMMPIRGDITMNDIFYPNAEVGKSFTQLDELPAPLGHPVINNVHVSAAHPVANNVFNVGGYLKNPRKKGKLVFTNLMLDTVVANQTEDGKNLIKRIKAGEKIGVSTGLNIANVETRNGKDDFGKEYSKIGYGFSFDHVAILMNEAAAGEHAGTELILNEGTDKEITVCELQRNELSTSDLHEMLRDLVKVDGCDSYAWVMDLYPESKTFVFTVEQKGVDRKTFKQSYAIDTTDEVSLLDDRIEVEKKIEYIPSVNQTKTNEVIKMDKDKLILAIIGNSANKFTASDSDMDKLNAMSEIDLVNALSAPVTKEQAIEILTNDGHDFEGYASFVANKDEFTTFLEAQNKARTEKVTNIVANSDYTDDMLKDKTMSELDVITNMMTKPNKRIGEGVSNVNNNNGGGEERATSYS